MSTAFAIALAGCLAVLAWIVGRPIIAARRRTALHGRALSAAENALLARHWPGYARVPQALVPRLDALTAVFLGEKEFVGCRGLAITPAIRLVVAAQACLLVLGRDRPPYELVRSVLIYPSQFVVAEKWHDEDGVVTEEERVLSGQAWDVSRILLSWEDVENAGDDDGGAYNVVIHEFAHYLDLEAGGADGTPQLDSAADRRRWSAVLASEFERLQDSVERGEETFLDDYAAQDEAEFFAVASEAFFEQPREFARRLPALYGELRGYYRLDPAAW
ncbi:MAG: M90 family metallopeptidase [Steroidobacteraceae bacterium]